MRILLVQPKPRYSGAHGWEALGIGYIAASLKDAGHQVKFGSGFFDTDDELIRLAADCDVVGFGCSSPQFRHALDLAAQMGNKRIVVGGVHPSALPERALEAISERLPSSEVSIVIGEGEGIADHLAEMPQILRVPPLAVDELPWPDRVAIKQERTIEVAYRDTGLRIASVVAGRGCPFACSFCASRSIWGRKARLRDPADVVEEMAMLVISYRVDFIKFADDTLFIEEGWLEDFARAVERKRLGVSWGANAHVNCIRRGRSTLDLAARVGCKELWFGVESGSPCVRRAMGKPADTARTIRIFDQCKDAGIKTRAYMLLGHPEEREPDIRLSEALVDRLRPNQVGWTILAPYPGTSHYDAGRHGETDWSLVDEYDSPFATEALRAHQQRLVRKYQQKACFRQRVAS